MNTPQIVFRKLLIGLVFFQSLFLAQLVEAEWVPSHLASITVELLFHSNLSRYQGTPEENLALEEARRRLRQAGVHRWSPQHVIIDDAAEKLAEPLDLDLNDTGDWQMLESLIEEPDTEQRRRLIEELYKGRKKQPNEQAMNEILSDFESAGANAMKDLARSHNLSVGDDGLMRIIWQPEGNAVQIIISGNTDEGEEYQVIYTGNVTPRPTEQGNHLRLEVTKREPGIQVFAGESLDNLRASIFGSWQAANGDLWDIAKVEGTQPDNSMNDQRQSNARQAESVRKKINDLKKQKVFVWKDPNGKIIRQKKFKRLSEPYDYVGEQFADSNAKEKIKALERQASQAEKAGKDLPVDTYDPTGMKNVKLDEAQPVRITVTRSDGYTYTFRQGYFDGVRITADRTQSDERDIYNLPDKVVQQLVASWSPPEWVELNAEYDHISKTISLIGKQWQLNVTYSSGGLFSTGSDYKVKRIHTPWSKKLALTQADVNTAEGAEAGILF